MPRLGLGLGLNLTRPIFLGGGSPSVPVGALATYTAYSPSNFTLVTGDSVNVWQDEASVTYGSEQVTNGDFSDGSTGWISYSSGVLSVTNNIARVEATTGAMIRQNSVIDNPNKKQLLSFRARCSKLRPIAYLKGLSIFTTSLIFTQTDTWQYFELVMEDLTTSNLVFGVVSGLTTGDYIEFEFASVKELETGSNDLTQSTSANQPVLVEDNTVTQFTASNQPTLVDDAGTWKLELDTNDYMEGLKTQSGDFTYVFKGLDIPNYFTINSRFIGQLGASTARFINVAGNFRINDDANSVVFNEPWNNESEIAVILSGSTLSVFMDGTQLGSDTDVTGSTFTTLTTLGNNSLSFQGEDATLNVFDRALTQTEIDYYSYLRSETGEILLPPLLPS